MSSKGSDARRQMRYLDDDAVGEAVWKTIGENGVKKNSRINFQVKKCLACGEENDPRLMSR